MDYIKRAIEEVVEHSAKTFKCILITGARQTGKSTLVKMLTGMIEPDSGKIEVGVTVKCGYFAQECEFMDPSQRVIDYIRDTAEVIHTKEGNVTASRMCERFLFGPDKQYAPIGKLSGGEKRRLYLLKILMEAPNLLILDEPTNDLDIMTLTILEDYLSSFEGIIIAVSHDRYFLDKLVNRLFVFRGNGVIEQVEGNYTDFREKELESIQEAKEKTSNNTAKTASPQTSWKSSAPKKLKMSYQEQKEFETIDDDIAGLEDELKELDKEIENNSTSYSKLGELMARKEELSVRLEAKTERWIYLNDLADRIEAEKK